MKDSHGPQGRSDEAVGLDEEQGERLLQYRAGEMNEEEQRRFEREVLGSPQLARALYEAEGLDAALRSGGPPAKKPSRLPLRVMLPLAAAAILLVALLPHVSLHTPLEPTPIFRGSETEFLALSPIGAVATSEVSFRWTSVEGAERYRLEVFDAESRPIFEVVSRDTSAVVDSAQLFVLRGRAGFWRVTALGELDRQLKTSAPAPLRLTANQR